MLFSEQYGLLDAMHVIMFRVFQLLAGVKYLIDFGKMAVRV